MDNTLTWQSLLKGAFAFDTAPFAVHPNDRKRALTAVSSAIRDGASLKNIESAIIEYLKIKDCDELFIHEQIANFRRFIKIQYKKIVNCYILSRPNNDDKEFIAIFSGREQFDRILYYAMHIYHVAEVNQATMYMRAKKQLWPTFSIKFHTFPEGGLWTGVSYIGSKPAYLLEKSDAWLEGGLNAQARVVWQPKPIPADPGPTWEGLRYDEKWGLR